MSSVETKFIVNVHIETTETLTIDELIKQLKELRKENKIMKNLIIEQIKEINDLKTIKS